MLAVLFATATNFGFPDMDGLANVNRADREALFVPAIMPRPVGLTSKRVIDIVLALFAIVLLAPLFIICFVVTACSSPGPILFRHNRVGFNGKRFDCLKFRTMADRCVGTLASASGNGSRCCSGVVGQLEVAQRSTCDSDWKHFAEIQSG